MSDPSMSSGTYMTPSLLLYSRYHQLYASKSLYNHSMQANCTPESSKTVPNFLLTPRTLQTLGLSSERLEVLGRSLIALGRRTFVVVAVIVLLAFTAVAMALSALASSIDRAQHDATSACRANPEDRPTGDGAINLSVLDAHRRPDTNSVVHSGDASHGVPSQAASDIGTVEDCTSVNLAAVAVQVQPPAAPVLASQPTALSHSSPAVSPLFHNNNRGTWPSTSTCTLEVEAFDDGTSLFDVRQNYPVLSCVDFTNDYKFKQSLGTGGQASVSLRVHHSYDGPIAVKYFEKKYQHYGVAEAEILRRLPSHRSVVSYIDAFFEGSSGFDIVLEYISGRSVRDLIPTTGLELQMMPDTKLGGIAHQLCSALAFLEAQGVVHRDIKPANTMITAEGLVKLIDFGLAVAVPVAPSHSWCGTLQYLAPEVLQNPPVQYGRASDVYSMGLYLLQLADSTIPRPGVSQEAMDQFVEQRARPAVHRVRTASQRDSHAVEFIQECLQWDQLKRKTATELMQHPFITEVACEQGDII